MTYISNTNYPTYTVEGNPPNTTYFPITCQACHDPHNASNPHQLRMSLNVTLSDGTWSPMLVPAASAWNAITAATVP